MSETNAQNETTSQVVEDNSQPEQVQGKVETPPVPLEKTKLQKELSRFDTAVKIVENLREKSQQDNFNPASVNYTDLEFILNTLLIGRAKVSMVENLTVNINQRSDNVSKALERLKEALPRISVS